MEDIEATLHTDLDAIKVQLAKLTYAFERDPQQAMSVFQSIRASAPVSAQP